MPDPLRAILLHLARKDDRADDLADVLVDESVPVRRTRESVASGSR